MIQRIVAFSVTLIMLSFAFSAVGQSTADSTSQIRKLRLEGRLAEAQSLAQQELAGKQSAHRQVELHLELARIHDRFGLHHNTRPVDDALRHIELAVEKAESSHLPSQARIELARAIYYYGAEMGEREFPNASKHAEKAIDIFGEIGDRHGEADAVHRLGLIELQRRNLDLARDLFERSLELDIAGGERTFFRGEYERHVGFVFLFKEDTAGAIPYLERSLEARREAGAIDASLFAAATLASVLVEEGRLEEAKPLLLYGMMIGEKINSPVGKARIGLVQGRLYAGEGDYLAARLAFEMTIRIAESVNYANLVALAKEELNALSTATRS